MVTNFLILVGPLHAQSDTVTGTLQLQQRIAVSPSSVAVITLTDRSKDGEGTIIGQQRIDGATGNDAFAVQFDPAVINPKHAYSIYASLIDGNKQWQNPEPVPTITGGPTEGLVVPLNLPAYQTSGQISGTLALPAGTGAEHLCSGLRRALGRDHRPRRFAPGDSLIRLRCPCHSPLATTQL